MDNTLTFILLAVLGFFAAKINVYANVVYGLIPSPIKRSNPLVIRNSKTKMGIYRGIYMSDPGGYAIAIPKV